MEKKKALLTCNEVKEMDMVNYLSQLGCEPVKVKETECWYRSPLREEKCASFKINTRLNRWYDFGLGQGGNLVDFGILYFRCSVAEFLQRLLGSTFPRAQLQGISNLKSQDNKTIEILREEELKTSSLFQYLKKRCIPVDLARNYCREIRYKIGEKTYYGIGFQNNSGGFEIRNPLFKSSSSPKDITTIPKGGNSVAVFEGFFDFLSFLVLNKEDQMNNPDFLILNSLAFFEKAKVVIEQYPCIRLFLDNDNSGRKITQGVLASGKPYIDESNLYRQQKDLNDYLCNTMNPDHKSNTLKRDL
jgi:hypothetical protein